MLRMWSAVWVCLAALSGTVCTPQSTEGLIAGRVTDALTAQALSGAIVTCSNDATQTVRSAGTGSDGLFAVPLLPPGVYRIQISRTGYQSKRQDEIALGVADSLELNFQLRPVQDIWESAMQSAVLLPQAGTILNFYGPDVDPNHWTAFASNTAVAGKLEASISDAVNPANVRELPLNGENIYAVLLAEPGVTANNATRRSLGIAAEGQRPSSSSFLLDGVEANFYLVSGPLLSVAPEATQEYRLSTNNFSAEYGGTAGYIANVVTRSGGNSWHGLSSFYLKNTVLNANEFQDNLASLPRVPDKEDRLGAFVGGPIWKKHLFSGTSVEYFRSRSQEEPSPYNLPNSAFRSFIGCPTTASYACQLLNDYPVSNSTKLDPFVAAVTLSRSLSVDQWLALQRLDYSAPEQGHHVSVRMASSNLSRPDFIWSPYRSYVSGMQQPVYNAAANWTSTIRPTITNQFSAGWSYERLSWARAHPEVPTLAVTGGNPAAIPLLPGSPAAYSMDNSGRYLQSYDNATIVRGRHILKIGAGGLWRRTNDFLGFGLDGEYSFCNILHFGTNLPPCPTATPPFSVPAIQFTAALARGASSPSAPSLDRSYRSSQYFAFGQDTFRVTARLVLNLGLRYDLFGPPTYANGARDWALEFGAGNTFNERLANAFLVPPASAPTSLFPSDNHSVAPRAGFAYGLSPSGHTLLRGGFGIFYDRLFDNLWLNARNNSFTFPSPVTISGYLPVSTARASYSTQHFVSDFPNLTAFQPHLRNGYAEDFFLGIRTEPAAAWSIELNGTGSLGRKLITTDVINRNGLINATLPAISYLSNQGLSDYYALNFVTRWRGHHGFLQASYTWSHVIDLQSDPLAGDFFNLDFVNIGPVPGKSPTAPNGAAFSTPYNSRGDRASADFDQRQTLVFYSYWQIQQGGSSRFRRIFADLRFSQLAAIRSGFPYSVFTGISSSTPDVINAYARPLDPVHALLTTRQPVPGGERLFDASAFCSDDTCPNAPSGRNAFAGPGLINLDVSVSRVLHPRWLGEGGGLTLRADFFNFLNHANLNPPGNIPGTSSYGVAVFGTPQQTAGFPSLIPLTQTARQIQLMVRVSF
jgi:hypothetical protein